MLQKLLDLLKLKSLKFWKKIHVHVIRHIRYQVNIDYHNQHESAALIDLFHTTSSVLPSVERKPKQRGLQGYLSSLRLCTFQQFSNLNSLKQNMIKAEVQWLQRNNLTRLDYDVRYVTNNLI